MLLHITKKSKKTSKLSHSQKHYYIIKFTIFINYITTLNIYYYFFNKKSFIILLKIQKMKAKFIFYILIISFMSIKSIEVSTVEELHKALEKAKAGQIIALAPGEYDYSTYDTGFNEFRLSKNGIESSPITLRAQDPENPPLLRAPTSKDGTVLHITGHYWIVENIRIGYCSRAIVIRNGTHNIIRNVEMFSIGTKAVMLRFGASHNLFQNCYIHDTGLFYPSYGDAFDIGIPLTETTNRNHQIADYNKIERCIFRHISSELINIREYATGNEVVGNVFYGEGINGKLGANNFILISGSDNYIHSNVGYRNQNEYIVTAFKVKKLAEDTGDGNIFENNILFMDRPYSDDKNEKRMYVVDGVDAQFSVKNNKVDYGEGFLDANSEEFYNSQSVTFLE